VDPEIGPKSFDKAPAKAMVLGIVKSFEKEIHIIFIAANKK